MSFNINLEQCSKMDIINSENMRNSDYIKNLKHVIEDLEDTEDNNTITDILPVIVNRFIRIYDDNYSLLEATEDDVITVIIKQNLQTAFDLAEICQEILNIICRKESIYLIHIKYVFKQILDCIFLFLKHWDCSSDIYKNLFNEDLLKLVEAVKHLFLMILNMLESSVIVQEDEENSHILADILITICKFSPYLFNVDVKTSVCTWKTFGTVTAKHSEKLESILDVTIPIKCLSETISKILNIFVSSQVDQVEGQIKILCFLMKILYKVSDLFYQQLDKFWMEIVMLFVQVLNFPDEVTLKHSLHTEIYENLEVFLLHLLMGDSLFKENMCDILKRKQSFRDSHLGILNLSNKTLKILNRQAGDYFIIIRNVVEIIFDVLLYAYKELLSDRTVLYTELVINISAAILLQDKSCSCMDILFKNIFHQDSLPVFLSLEIFTVVSRNISDEEGLSLLISILYNLNDLQYGHFTNSPEKIYLKHLVQRMFYALPDVLKDQVVKQFSLSQYQQVWNFLGLVSIRFQQGKNLMKPALEKASQSITRLCNECTEDFPVNIAEALDLLSTSHFPANDPDLMTVVRFVSVFWDLDLNQSNLLENNIIRYLTRKMYQITVKLLKSCTVNPQLVFSKLIKLSCKQGYWVTVYSIVDEILHFTDSYKQQVLKEASNIISTVVQNPNNIIKQHYYEMLFDLNRTHKETFNTLLDTLNPVIAHQVFQSLEPLSIMEINIEKRHHFQHKCIKWKQKVVTNDTNPYKKPKLDIQSKPLHYTKHYSKNTGTKSIDVEEEDESSTTEVINRLKGEIKCLLKVTKTEKLTPKNVSDLRILISQIDSLMR